MCRRCLNKWSVSMLAPDTAKYGVTVLIKADLRSCEDVGIEPVRCCGSRLGLQRIHLLKLGFFLECAASGFVHKLIVHLSGLLAYFQVFEFKGCNLRVSGCDG